MEAASGEAASGEAASGEAAAPPKKQVSLIILAIHVKLIQ